MPIVETCAVRITVRRHGYKDSAVTYSINGRMMSQAPGCSAVVHHRTSVQVAASVYINGLVADKLWYLRNVALAARRW